MKLKIEYINEDTSEKLILKNRDGKVYYHSSRTHDPREFQPLSGLVLKLPEDEREVVRYYYELAGRLV